MANNFLPFAPTDTGSNLLTQAEYLAATDRTIGNQPGVASAKLVNKALRQAAYISSQFAQYMADKLGADLLDDATPARLLAQINAAMLPIAPVYTKKTAAGATTHQRTFYFFIATGSATAGATYTNSTFTFTVKETVAAGTLVACTGTGIPAVNGTLTKSGGTGDNSLIYYSMRQALYMRFRGIGGGAGGGGGGSAGGNGTAGTATTVASTVFVANGGDFGRGSNTGRAGDGGTASLGTGAVGAAIQGGGGGGSSTNGAGSTAGCGGASHFGGASAGGAVVSAGAAAAPNSGGGGSGSPSNGQSSGSGGGSGGFFDGYLLGALAATFACVVGAKGVGGSASGGGLAGEDGADGILEIWEMFQ